MDPRPPAAPPRQPLPGDTVGPFRVLRPLGRGGMAVVFEAEDTELPRRVALKVLADADPQAKLRFVREAHAQARISHDNVVTIFRVGEDRGVSYIAMPVLHGQSLAQALAATPRPPLPAVVRIASEVADGLAAAHAAGLVHRDIKPGNVWLEAPKWRVKILDFGLVRDPHAATQIDITMQGHVVGTPAYMSPEQAAGRAVDHRTDLWSLGVVLYQMATGRRPFADDNTVDLMTAIVSAEAPAPLALAPDLPPALADLIRRLLAKDPARRPATAAAVSAELDAVGKALVAPPVPAAAAPAPANPWGDLDATETALARGAPLAAQAKRASGGRGAPKWLWVGGGAAAVLLAGALLLALDAPGGRPRPTEAAAPAPPKPAAPRPAAPKKEPDHERQAAEMLAPFAKLSLELDGEPKAVEVPAGGALPAGRFTVAGIDFGGGGDRALNAAFVSGVFLPAAARLKGLTDVRADRWQADLSADHLRQMAATPLADTLRTLELSAELSPESLPELKRFRALAGLVLVAPEPSDELFARLAELPRVRHLGLHRLGRSGRLTHKGWDAVAGLPLDAFALGWSRGGPDALRAFGARDGPLPALTFVACDLSDQALRDHLKPATDVRAIEFRSVDLTDAALTPLAEVRSLRTLALSDTKVTARGLTWLAAAHPELRVVVGGRAVGPNGPRK